MAVVSVGSGDACWDLDGLEAGLQVSGDGEVEGEETAGVGDVEGEEPADDVRRSGRFWLDERRRLLPSPSPPAAVFRRSLRWWEESSNSPSSYLRAI